MRTYFLSFGNGLKFFGSRQRIASEAESLRLFDDIMVAGDHALGADFRRDRGALVKKHKRGYGLWSWKPYLVLKRLEAIEDGGLLMYADVGCSLNLDGRSRLQEYFDMTSSGPGWLCFSLQGNTIGQWTKRAMLRSHRLDESAVRTRPQLVSAFHLIRASEATRLLARQWYDACGKEAEMNDDVSADEHPEFIAHRHDQSAFSLLAVNGPVESISDESWFEPDWNANLRYPLHARRWKHRIPWPSSWLRSRRWERTLRRM